MESSPGMVPLWKGDGFHGRKIKFRNKFPKKNVWKLEDKLSESIKPAGSSTIRSESGYTSADRYLAVAGYYQSTHAVCVSLGRTLWAMMN